MSNSIDVQIVQGDITKFSADVVALKYAQAYYGADKAVAEVLGNVGGSTTNLRPMEGEYRYINTFGKLSSPHTLFVGVVPIEQFRYKHIRDFSTKVLAVLADEAPQVKHLALTLHGADTGLDEAEALLSQIAGILEALQYNHFPKFLIKISLVEIDMARAKRLRQILDNRLADVPFAKQLSGANAFRLFSGPVSVQQQSDTIVTTALQNAGDTSESKPHVFVAMPFANMDDVYHFGIEQPVRAAGLLCERVDQTHFSGSIVDQIKKRIESATVVIAELSGANPNVYLEVGYAWGKARHIILLVKDVNDLCFDLKGENCLVYSSIKQLAHLLSERLQMLELHSST